MGVSASLEVWAPAGRVIRELAGDRATLGKSPANDLIVDWDRSASRLHAVLERFGDDWAIRDLGSSNGTWVNADRVDGARVLRDGDEVRVGKTRLVYRAAATADLTKTDVGVPAPSLTRRERDVLVALCRPVLSGAVFAEPASTRQMAEELVVAEATVKEYLGRLYDKFGLQDSAQRRRHRLANEAVQRGAVTIADLRS